MPVAERHVAQINRVPCPPWCVEEHAEPPGDARRHRAPAGDFRRPALHTRLGRLLRPEQGLLQVELHVNDDAAGRRDEERIAVVARDGTTLELTNGEARRLAALLAAAADQLDGI